MERRLQASIRSSLDAMAHTMNNLRARVTAVEEQVDSQAEDEQEDDNPLDSGQWRESPTEPHPAMGRELRANPLQGGPALTRCYMGVRSTHFEQMDVDPPENNNRQEPIANNDPRNAGVEEEDELVNDSWRMRVKALFTSLDEADRFSRLQLTRKQEILTNFLQTAHLYKPSDGYKINHSLQAYTFGEIISECEGMLVQLNRTSVENAAEGIPPAGSNAVNEIGRAHV